ncbi:MAG TPA: polysaccharide deacetylase family protein [bacterium]|nr:polysaccharide deacetylase family protein [bacterium]HOM27025.1 polysaccharide deacetylase family protein [bacterium]
MILAYHRINPWYNDALTVKPEYFKKQIEYLISKKFLIVPVEEYLKENKKILKRKIVITFDDGFADNFWFAFDILKSFRIFPLIFLIVDYTGTNKIFSRYKDKEKDRFLNWKEINEMIKEGVEIGSHTLTHPHLTQISEKTAKEEIISSKKIIEDKTGKEIKFFCYPYGEFNEKIIDFVKLAGYKGAFVTPKRGQKIKWTDFTMKRIGIYGHNNFFIYKLKIWKEYLKGKI